MPTVKTEQKTILEGIKFAKKLRGGDIVLLHGELGAGKTTFVKGIARGLDVKETITSPTFTLMNVYHIPKMDPIGRAKRGLQYDDRGSYRSLRSLQNDTTGILRQLCHIDTYRLKNVDELRAIGAEDYIGEPHTITVIEWPEKIAQLLRSKSASRRIKNVFFRHIDGGRSITVQ